jgi:hypothetical protein
MLLLPELFGATRFTAHKISLNRSTQLLQKAGAVVKVEFEPPPPGPLQSKRRATLTFFLTTVKPFF